VGVKTIPISVAVLALLESMPKMLGSKRVIHGSESQMEHLWREVRDAAKIPDVRLHDLRHTFASYGAAKGLSLPIIGALLGQGHAATTQRYAHLAQSPLREAVEKIGDALGAAMAQKKAPGGA
jgi:integrase